MKKIQAVFCIVICVSIFTACSAKTSNQPEISSMVQAVDAAIGNDGSMVAVDENYIKGSMKMDVSSYADYTVKINAMGANIDEYGVFKGSDSAQVKEIKTSVDRYLQMREDTWMTEYMPEEHPKLLAAEVWTEGNYVMYAILDDDAKTSANEAFASCFIEG